MFNDTISDMLTRMRNALMCKHLYVNVSRSKLSVAVLQVFLDKGLINGYVEYKEKNLIRVFLKYYNSNVSIIAGLKRISKPGRRIYVKHSEIPIIYRGMGICVVSTSKGVMSGSDARKDSLGGELMCSVW